MLADIAGIGPGRDLVEIERTALTGPPESAGSRPEGERTDVAIGRDADVAAVLDACATADVVIVAGESGIGKTTLLDSLATRLRARGAVVGRGSSGVAASGAFPALQGVLHDLGVTSWDTSGDRVAQATAFARALLEAAGGAVTLLLDDAHWLTEDELHIVADEFSNFEVNY